MENVEWEMEMRAGVELGRGSIVNCGLVDLTNCVKLLSLSALD